MARVHAAAPRHARRRRRPCCSPPSARRRRAPTPLSSCLRDDRALSVAAYDAVRSIDDDCRQRRDAPPADEPLPRRRRRRDPLRRHRYHQGIHQPLDEQRTPLRRTHPPIRRRSSLSARPRSAQRFTTAPTRSCTTGSACRAAPARDASSSATRARSTPTRRPSRAGCLSHSWRRARSCYSTRRPPHRRRRPRLPAPLLCRSLMASGRRRTARGSPARRGATRRRRCRRACRRARCGRLDGGGEAPRSRGAQRDGSRRSRRRQCADVRGVRVRRPPCASPSPTRRLFRDGAAALPPRPLSVTHATALPSLVAARCAQVLSRRHRRHGAARQSWPVGGRRGGGARRPRCSHPQRSACGGLSVLPRRWRGARPVGDRTALAVTRARPRCRSLRRTAVRATSGRRRRRSSSPTATVRRCCGREWRGRRRLICGGGSSRVSRRRSRRRAFSRI